MNSGLWLEGHSVVKNIESVDRLGVRVDRSTASKVMIAKGGWL